MLKLDPAIVNTVCSQLSRSPIKSSKSSLTQTHVASLEKLKPLWKLQKSALTQTEFYCPQPDSSHCAYTVCAIEMDTDKSHQSIKKCLNAKPYSHL